MINIISNNPYRILGVYSNSPKRDQVANKGRISAFLRVNRPAVLPLDFNNILPELSRTTESVNNADASLALAHEQVKYAQFWFMKASPLDDIAFNHIYSGNIELALDIWGKATNISSLQNRFVCYLIQGKCAQAINEFVQPLYEKYGVEFIKLIAGDNVTITSDDLIKNIVDTLSEEKEISISTLYSSLYDQSWKNQFKEKLVTPLISTLENEVVTAKASKNEGTIARYNAGTKLMNATKAPLGQLKDILSISNMQYQVIADKVGIEILQCGIDYFNKSKASDAPFKAMTLQKYAQSIVVGSMAKDRCNENVKILQGIIDNLPPQQIAAEVNAINAELKKFCALPNKISHSITLLTNTKPYLQRIKNQVGSTDSYYLKISTKVVDNALYNVIEEVNGSQNMLSGIPRTNASLILASVGLIKNTMDSAWNAITLMDSFDMENSFLANRYNPNRSTLSNLRRQIQGLYNQIHGNSSGYSSGYSGTSATSNSSNSGCIVWLILAITTAIVVSCSCL